MKIISKFQGRTANVSLVFGLMLTTATVIGCKAKQSDSSAKEFQAKVGSGLGALQLIGLDPADGKVKIRACSTEEQKQAILTASDDIVDGILPVDFSKCPTKATDDLGKEFKELTLEEYKAKLAVHLGARDFSSDEFIIAGAYLDLEALIRAYGKKEFIDGLGQLDTNRSDIDSLILQPGAVLDDIKEDGDYAQRAEQSYNDQLAKLEQFKKYRVREKDQIMFNKVVARLESTLNAQKNNWAQTQAYKYILLHIESKFAKRGEIDRNAKLISSQGQLYKSAIFPLKNIPDLKAPRTVLSVHRICRELGGTVATFAELSDAGLLENLSGDSILTGNKPTFLGNSVIVDLYNPGAKKIERREMANVEVANDKIQFRFACSTSRKESLDIGNAKLCYAAFAFELNRYEPYFTSTEAYLNGAGKTAKPEHVKTVREKRDEIKKKFSDPYFAELKECQAEHERFPAKSNSRDVGLPADYKEYASVYPEILVDGTPASAGVCKCGPNDGVPKYCLVFKGSVTFSTYQCSNGSTNCCTQEICNSLLTKTESVGKKIWVEPTECNGKVEMMK